MLTPAKNLPKNFDPLSQSSFPQEFTSSFINFCSEMSGVFELKSLLLTLKAQIPKQFKTGELVLFYNSDQLGLRRAYIKHSRFYEEKVKNLWMPVQHIQSCSTKQNLYLAEECGRPFFKSLAIPLDHSHSEAKSILFVEITDWKHALEDLIQFFEERHLTLNLVFKRVFLNSRWTRIPYFWNQLFTYWGEPLAILRDFKTVRVNDSFKTNLSLTPDFFKQKKIPKFIETKKNIYHVHYYPIPQFQNLYPTGILYCQDMTKQFHLKELLFQSEKMSSLCELGKNMAHQLNNPLTGVRCMAQILCQKPELSSFKEELEEVEKAVQRSQKIIENLISFSQPQKEQQTCDLNQVVQDTLPLLKSMTRGLKLEVELCKQPVKITGDFTLLQQATYNLILNACQALNKEVKRKKPCIQISVDKNLNHKVCLTIKDNGPGIAQHNLEKIFQPLWTSKKIGEGTGFGLGIARKFIRKLNGDILVSSKENEFSCFTIQLPLHPS